MKVGDRVAPVMGDLAGKVGVVKKLGHLTAPPYGKGGVLTPNIAYVKFKGIRSHLPFRISELMIQKEIETDMTTGNPFADRNRIPRNTGPTEAKQYIATVELAQKDPTFYTTVVAYLELPKDRGGCGGEWDWPNRLIGPNGENYDYDPLLGWGVIQAGDDNRVSWHIGPTEPTDVVVPNRGLPFNLEPTVDDRVPRGKVMARDARGVLHTFSVGETTDPLADMAAPLVEMKRIRDHIENMADFLDGRDEMYRLGIATVAQVVKEIFQELSSGTCESLRYFGDNRQWVYKLDSAMAPIISAGPLPDIVNPDYDPDYDPDGDDDDAQDAPVSENKAPVSDETSHKGAWAGTSMPGHTASRNVAEIMKLVDAYADAKTCEHDAGNRPELYTQTDEELERRVNETRNAIVVALVRR